MHKGLIKKLIDKNFHMILSHMESELSKNVFLKEIDAEIRDLDLRILPKGGLEWSIPLESDLFFDQGQIVVEISNMEFKGHGQLTDP